MKKLLISLLLMPCLLLASVEHACWYITWTSWDHPVPESVDVINLFVGEISLDSQGNPTVGGFDTFTDKQIKDFAASCKESSIGLKISLGGGGGKYDHCWDVLTDDNAEAFGQMLASYCKSQGLLGVDFDYEVFTSPEQETLVGRCILAFKQSSPNLQASLCTNAGFSSWQKGVQQIVDTTVSGGKCLLDRLYIMSYYDSLASEEGYVLQWAEWMKKTYSFSPSQITVGIDSFDAHAYKIDDFSKWAASQGFSTGYWAWNPADPSNSNTQTETILKAYQAQAVTDEMTASECKSLLW